MDIRFTQRLSYKQARLTVLVGFVLGTLLSLMQIGIDYASEDASINREILSLLEISHNPASRIAYNIDAELAQELSMGLLRSPAIIGAELIDNNNTVLASVKRPELQSSYRFISDFLFGAQRQFEDRLYLDHLPSESLGMLRLDVDTFAFGSRFLRRAEVTLLNGFARSLILTGLLLALFYVMLTKPLVRVIRELSSRDPSSNEQSRLECPTGHQSDEIGVLVSVANQQFENISTEIQQRRTAENRLTEYLAQLENIVSARTAELKASNARLSQSNEELEVARRTALDMAEARSAFLANMSHEIRTPLNGLLGMIALSLDGPLTAEQQQQLSIAHDSGKVLVELLNDILDLSKFDAGQLELEHIPFDLGSLVEDTANLLSQNAAPQCRTGLPDRPAVPGASTRRPDPGAPDRQQPAVQRTEIHALRPGRREVESLRGRRAHRDLRHGYRHSPGSPGKNPATVHPGRRRDYPPVRWHRAGPGTDLQPLRSHAGPVDDQFRSRLWQSVLCRPAPALPSPGNAGRTVARQRRRHHRQQQRPGRIAGHAVAGMGPGLCAALHR
nr:hypothetical protein GCM10020185_07750 [Pseudomonas brassicacearum subsp. brassicacearum]